MSLRRLRKLVLAATAALLVGAPAIGQAGPIPADVWLEFSFGAVSDPVRGCDPLDPLGPICLGSGLVEALDAPPWTFTSGAAGVLTVTDAGDSGDRFEVFDFGTSLGLTSVPAASGAAQCAPDPLDPIDCLATAGMSSGIFALAAGAHSLTLATVASNDSGLGFLRVSAPLVTVPEPSAVALLAAALLALAIAGARRPA